MGAFLVGSVLVAVHHAEVIAHRVGEPFGSPILAVAVTVIEVALIVTLMVSGGSETSTLARDTVFAAAPPDREALTSLLLLVVAPAALVGLAKVESPAIARAVAVVGARQRPSAS